MKKLVTTIALIAAVLAPAAFAGESKGPLDARPDIVFVEGSGDAFLFPVAGSVAGANGTYFRSEVTLVNFRNAPQEILVEFLQRGATAPTTVRITIEPRFFRFWDDFVASVIGRPGVLGSLRLRGVISGTNVTDTSAQLNGFSRIWTPVPGTNGTSSMSLPAIEEADLSAPGLEAAYIIGLRQDAQYRTNVGIVNLENFDRTFVVEPNNTFPSATLPSFTVTVPARSMQQASLPEGHFGGIVFRVKPTSAGLWSAYAASVDNFSGDGWISKAQYSARAQ